MILPALALALAAGQPAPVVRTDDGPVRGVAIPGGGGVFRGIRFAKPPVGPLRWRAPERPTRRSQVVDTIAEHSACAQLVYGDWNRAAAGTSSEDCLFLDIRTPRLADTDARSAKPLPVLVWIHGGANRAGAGGGTVESRITNAGIVLVSIQYRLGALGFLSHPSLSREQGGHSGNYALMDQQAALAWVQRNIARFGGDPHRVTIAGESAGAQDVALHRFAPASRALFAQAIQESGTAGFGVAPRTLAENERLGRLIATTAGLSPMATPALLRSLPVATILAAQDAVDVSDLDDDSFIWLQAVIDGRVITDTPAHLLATGHVSRAPLIAGVNARELTLHGGLPAAPATVRREFGQHADRAATLYGLQPGGSPVDDKRLGDVTVQLADDLTFRCPTVALSKALTRVGVPVWQYQFDYAPPGATVSHASELGFVFNAAKPGEPPLQAYWANFVKTGDPNGAGLPLWPAYSQTARAYLAVDQTGPVARQDLRGAICGLRDAP